MSKKLAEYFSKGSEQQQPSVETERDHEEEDDMGPSVSMAVQADDDEQFHKSTFNLKRTRSMGLLDEYIDPTKKLMDRGENEDEVDVGVDAESSGLETGRPSESTSPPVPDTDNYLVPHDDNDLVIEPQRHVDYLSHKWEENEISQSWKYIILKKKKKDEDLVNAARLENASWRTWAKARNNLKTVTPEAVNWSKDSDVTWLYGPILRPKEGSSIMSDGECGYGSDDETSKRMTKSKPKKQKGPKPILKKRSVSEIIKENSLWRLNVARQHRKQLGNTSPVMDGYGGNYAPDDYDALADKVNAQYYRSAPDANRGFHTTLHTQDDISPSPETYSTSHFEDMPTETLPASILSTAAGKNSKSSEHRDRHIHFSDRVEQCMALNAQHRDADVDEHERDYDSDPGNEYFGDNHRKLSTGRDQNLYHVHSDDEPESSSSEDEEAGLFISARFARKNEGVHSPSEHSSIGSTTSKHNEIPPIIKLLPSTTLNYGSDDEDYEDDEDSYYGRNAVSHNVNTFRGYDYLYDYNSVYTGDTSNFMAVNNCDMVDVPEGLQTPVDEDHHHDDAGLPQTTQRVARGGFSFDDDSDSYNSNDDSQFIENSQTGASDDETDLALRRTSSIGKGSNSSLHGLPSSTAPVSSTHSFVTGKPLEQPVQQHQSPQQHLQQSQKQEPLAAGNSRKKTKSFILNSESDSDSAEDENASDVVFEPADMATNQNGHTATSATYDNQCMIPTQGTSITSMSKSPRLAAESPVNRVMSSGNSHASLSDVAIAGYISPRSESMQSVVAKEKMVDGTPSPDVEHMNKNLENWHIGHHKDDGDAKDSDESLHKMMSSARELASKYLHSWK
ncbi:LAMI_0C05820g1_1 [Lachancea mirantina]|uniref:LAMI_0C05820g1_1 n=1 Tax=Lachancea mirantina TaxID=1230905 RepID=A0A1G4J3I8_9SACH|nr:LAMI_0C05820g1_1 [Lachancea mirantina]